MPVNFERRISAFSRLGSEFKVFADELEMDPANEHSEPSDLHKIRIQSSHKNPWFTNESIAFAFRSWSRLLREDKLRDWLRSYHIEDISKEKIKCVAVINAGNIPLVGFHDFLTVLMSGHRYQAKNASDDPFLLPFIASRLIRLEPAFAELVQFTDRLADFDAVIATGSNNSSRYFNYYFSKYPHIIRRNRNAVAILNGSESANDLKNLGEDIFRYFGLGCRNVSKLYVPGGYNFNAFFEAIYEWNGVMQHNKYMNNFEHHNAVYLLKRIPFLQNGFLIIKEDHSIASPVAVVHYEYYSSEDSLTKSLLENRESIQCIVSGLERIRQESSLAAICVPFGQTQQPGLTDYADGVDTMRFLSEL